MVFSKSIASALLCVALVFVGCGTVNNQNADVASEQEMSVAEETLANYASDSEFKALGLGKKSDKKPLVKKAEKKIEQNAQQAAARAKRKANIQKALADLRAVRALPAANLQQAGAKCTAISNAVNFLKSTNAPKRPVDGLRKSFRKALRAERTKSLSAIGVVSCGKVKNLIASLPPAAPVPVTPADEMVAEVDAVDEVVLAAYE